MDEWMIFVCTIEVCMPAISAMPFAGVSVISNGKLSGSATTMVCGAASGYHLLVVDGYSRIKDMPNSKNIRSRPFRVGGYWWVILYSPNGERSQDFGYVSLTLALDHDQQIPRPVKLKFEFSFIEQVEEQRSARVRAGQVVELSAGASCGHHRWMKRTDFDKSEHLRDDGFIIRCDLFVVDAKVTHGAVEVPNSDILDQFGELLRTQLGTDVTFKVGGERFAAHRCVLAARSSVFRAQLFGSMMEGTTTANAINIKDMAPNVFRALLTFIYTDAMPNMEEDDQLGKDEGNMEDDEYEEDEYDGAEEEVMSWLQHVLVAADRFDLPRLKLLCEEQLSEHIDIMTVMTILALAEQHRCCGLKEACLQFLQILSPTRLQNLLATQGWDHIAENYPAVVNQLIFKLASKC
nr:BTB/POZ and MATH domain-containing protein 2-like [Lolium perenne]